MAVASSSCVVIAPPTRLNRIDKNTATPTVPPSCRKKVADAVATPISRGLTAFCTIRVSGCMQLPRPMPRMSM